MTVDWNSVRVRLENIIITLTTSHVREGFELDRMLASGALTYIEGQAKGAPDDDAGWNAVVEFCKRYGQSLDWIIYGNMNVMICRLAASWPEISEIRKSKAA